METGEVKLHFEQNGSQLTAVEIDHGKRSPLIAKLHSALFALGIVVAAYQVRTGSNGFVERILLTRRDGSVIQGQLSEATRAAIMPIALNDEADEAKT
jgi:hypothetical protein